MSPANGHDKTTGIRPQEEVVRTALLNRELSDERIVDLVSRLEVPFDPCVIEWRVTNTSRNGKLRGQVMPYADQRAYTDRLNALFTPAGWSRSYEVHTGPAFPRGKDKIPCAKVIVACTVTISNIGSHSATGEEWADNENAGTIAEAQSFKRACCCFGLGRYLYDFEGVWVDLDERKRPRTAPELPRWATPDGWMNGLRPHLAGRYRSNGGQEKTASASGPLVTEIESLATSLGRGLYRGLLKDIARVWSPRDIHDTAVLNKVLEHMRGAERGLGRLKVAIEAAGPEPVTAILKSLGITSLERVESLETLKRIVVATEAAASKF